jgi:hypothetical protein
VTTPTVRCARIRTTHADATAAAVVAEAVAPDNTESMSTRVEGATVETTVERDTTGGLHSSVDDYVVNVTVADRLVGSAADTAAADAATAGDGPSASTATTDAMADPATDDPTTARRDDEQTEDETTDTDTKTETDDTHDTHE